MATVELGQFIRGKSHWGVGLLQARDATLREACRAAALRTNEPKRTRHYGRRTRWPWPMYRQIAQFQSSCSRCCKFMAARSEAVAEQRLPSRATVQQVEQLDRLKQLLSGRKWTESRRGRI